MLRKLAIRLVLWLCRVYDISLVNEARTHNGGGAIARGEQWEQFARESGGLFDMIEAQRREAFEAYSETRPDQVHEKNYLAMQDRCWRQIKARVNSVIQNGRVEADKQRRQTASISPIRKSV